jgi:hypothetical protein
MDLADQINGSPKRLKSGLTECIGCGCLSLDPWRLRQPRRPRRETRGGAGIGSALARRHGRRRFQLRGITDYRKVSVV